MSAAARAIAEPAERCWRYAPKTEVTRASWTCELGRVERGHKGWFGRLIDGDEWGETVKCEPHYPGHRFEPAAPTAYYRTANGAKAALIRAATARAGAGQ